MGERAQYQFYIFMQEKCYHEHHITWLSSDNHHLTSQTLFQLNLFYLKILTSLDSPFSSNIQLRKSTLITKTLF